MHYDPTWSLDFWNLDFKDIKHYQLIKYLDELPEVPEKYDKNKIKNWSNVSSGKLT